MENLLNFLIMKLAAIPVFLLARTYAHQTGLRFWTLKDQLNAINQLLLTAKTYLK